MVSEQIVYAFSWASWSGIFAGAAAAVAVSIIMSVFGVALGFGMVKPKSDEPLEHMGVAFGGWSAATIIVSLAVGGFIAGLFSGQRGIEHGFLVWSVVTIVGTFIGSLAVGGAFRAITSGIKSVSSGAANAAATLGKGVVDMSGEVVKQLRENVHLEVDQDKLTGDIRKVLSDTGIETLQPEYLEQQMREARSDLRSSLHQLALKPSDYEQVVSSFLHKQQSRLESITQKVDRNAAVKTLMNKRSIPQDEAEKMVDNAIEAYETAVSKAKSALTDAREQAQEAKVQLKEMAQKTREKADTFASQAAKAALAAGIAMVIAAVVTMGAGACGSRYASSWYAVASTFTVR